MSERDYILHHIDQQGRVVRSNQMTCIVCVYYHDNVHTKMFEDATCAKTRPLTADQKPDGTRASWCINGAFEFIEENDNVCDS